MMLPEAKLYTKRPPPLTPMLSEAQKLLAVDLTGTINAVFGDKGGVEEVECDPSVIMKLGKCQHKILFFCSRAVKQLENERAKALSYFTSSAAHYRECPIIGVDFLKKGCHGIRTSNSATLLMVIAHVTVARSWLVPCFKLQAPKRDTDYN